MCVCVFVQGIEPFLSFIESSEREFFKAKDFVTLYESAHTLHTARARTATEPSLSRCLLLLCVFLSLIFKMCIQRDPFNWSETMYELYTHSILNYLLGKVEPALKNARTQYDVALLREWKHRWSNQKLIVQGLAKLFMYLDRFYTPNTSDNKEHETRKQAAHDAAPGLARRSLSPSVLL